MIFRKVIKQSMANAYMDSKGLSKLVVLFSLILIILAIFLTVFIFSEGKDTTSKDAGKIGGSAEYTDEYGYTIRTDSPIDFSSIEAFKGSEEAVSIYAEGFSMATNLEGSWVNFKIPTNEGTNFIKFDLEFRSRQGAEGLFSVYLEGELLGSVDERFSIENPSTEVIMYGDIESGLHVFSFRLDNFGGPPSSVYVKNVSTGWAGFL
jgi:hypothetical protein